MKLKQAITGAAIALACAPAVQAQTAGTVYVSTGWFHFAPQSSSDPLKEISLGSSPINQSSPNTGASVGNADTLALSLGYFITDHLSAEFEAGVPPKFDINGTGSFSSFGKLGTARLWSPALLLKWNFRSADAKFRPYVGLGVTRVWFSDAQLTNGAFESTVLKGPTSVSTDSSWAPVFNAGFNYSFTKHWFAGVSVSYIPVSTTANFTSTNVGPFGLTLRTQAKIRLNPIVTYAKIGYAF
ncbi:MAG TPA: OmpW family outer membrane protein [Trinickia sp.]|jgi:outer membrane protein|uniref:OmpW/AlkL family protein n=1 Tax=Trinickia sp. TaxID=2571163 RepID=UPI002BD4B3D6|nr:OmpW family outer membrane protein [Trinickia sp.]HTI16996.1 OmpW family outer membrane protein [Trinickia sp.]